MKYQVIKDFIPSGFISIKKKNLKPFNYKIKSRKYFEKVSLKCDKKTGSRSSSLNVTNKGQ